MYFILEDGHLEIDNNAAERAIKPFVIGPRIGYFAKIKKELMQVLQSIV